MRRASSSASSSSAARSASASSGCARARPGSSSRRWLRRCAPRSPPRTATLATRGRAPPRCAPPPPPTGGVGRRPTAGGMYELLRDAHELVPGLRELQIEELSVGLRPGTPDNAPVLGAGALEGLSWATGHHRNGVLLAPLTAELLCGVL